MRSYHRSAVPSKSLFPFRLMISIAGVALAVLAPYVKAEGRDSGTQKVKKTSTRTEEELLKVLSQGNEAAEIVSALREFEKWVGVEKNPRAAKVLRELSERQLSDKSTDPVAEHILIDSLRALGLHGDAADVAHLQRWISGEDFLSRVDSRQFGPQTVRVRQSIQEAAIWGLGLSGNPSALGYLRKIKDQPPPTANVRSLLGVVADAIETNEEIAVMGATRYFSSAEQERRSKRIEERLRPIFEERERRRKEKRQKK